MIEERATVVSVDEKTTLIQAERQSTCGSCSVNKGCGTATIAKVVGNKRSFISLNTANQSVKDLQAGDQVIIGLNENSLLGSSALAYLLPLVLFFISALLAQSVGPQIGLSGEGFVILAGFAGLAAGVGVVRYLINQPSRRSIEPVILRRL